MSILILKEVKDFFKSKATALYFLFLSLLVGYSFYSAIDLYSKASIAAVDNPLYATGFEPTMGVFVPTFGALFIAISLVSPFMFINLISIEKRLNTIFLAVQYPFSFFKFYLSKVIAGIFILLISLSVMLGSLFLWDFYGGHISIAEISLLFSGYFLYGMFALGVSFFSASIFRDNAQASVFSLGIIMFSWFLDFGKEMKIIPFLKDFVSITYHLKNFENGILSMQSVIYILSLTLFFLYLAYVFFNFTLRQRLKYLMGGMLIFILINYVGTGLQSYDLSENKKNSFSKEKNELIRKLSDLKIKIYLEPTDSRAKDYENDFLKKLRLIRKDVKIEYIKGKNLNENYGKFVYVIGKKQQKTTSNSEEEIFMILSELSGIKLSETGMDTDYKGYPLVVKNKRFLIFIFYLIFIPLSDLFTFYLINYKKRSYSEKDI